MRGSSRHARIGAECGQLRGEPVGGRAAVDRAARAGFAQQRAAELGLLVAEDDAGAGSGRRLSAAARPAGPAPTTSTSQWAKRLA